MTILVFAKYPYASLNDRTPVRQSTVVAVIATSPSLNLPLMNPIIIPTITSSVITKPISIAVSPYRIITFTYLIWYFKHFSGKMIL